MGFRAEIVKAALLKMKWKGCYGNALT